MNDKPQYMDSGFDNYRPREIRKEKVIYDRKCKTCGNKKDGLDTVCNGYKCIPQSVQQGGTCEKYNGVDMR